MTWLSTNTEIARALSRKSGGTLVQLQSTVVAACSSKGKFVITYCVMITPAVMANWNATTLLLQKKIDQRHGLGCRAGILSVNDCLSSAQGPGDKTGKTALGPYRQFLSARLFARMGSIMMRLMPGYRRTQEKVMSHSLTKSRMFPARLHIILWGALMLVTLYLLLYDWSGYQVGTYGDDGSYVAATESLLYDGNYGMFLDPAEFEPTQFPFVYPLLLAPLRVWFPDNLDALRIVSLAATLALLTVLFWGWGWFGGGLSYWWGLALTAVLALSPVTILHGRTVMSEAVFLLFVLLLVLWVEYVVERSPRAWGVLLGVIAVGTVYSRTVGWAFLLPAVAYLIWKLRGTVGRQLGVAAATMAALLVLIVTLTTVRPVDLLPQEYLAQLSVLYRSPIPSGTRPGAETADPAVPGFAEASLEIISRGSVTLLNHLDIADKLPYQMERAVIDATDQMGMPFMRYVPIVGALVLVILGTVVWVRLTGATLLIIVAPPYILMLMLWGWNGSRLMYPVQPQLFLALMLGLYAVGSRLAARLPGNDRRLLVIASVAVVLLWLGGWVWLDLRLTRTMLLPGDQMARAAVLERHIPTDAIVLSSRAETDFLYSPQRFVKIPRARIGTAELRHYLIANQASYVIAPFGAAPVIEVRKLRVPRMTRFLTTIAPLIEARALVELYNDVAGDIAIYRVDKQTLGALAGD